ncbi:MAG: hypothetical protein R6W76_01515, partial [Caldilinea sp.]
MRKYMWMTTLLLVAVLALSACTAMPAAPAAPGAEQATEAAAEAPAAEGAYAGVDPTGQTVVWWHQHSGSREENLLKMIAEFNESNEFGITIDPQNQGGYDQIRDKVNSSIAAGELPAALLVGYQNDQSFYQLNDT